MFLEDVSFTHAWLMDDDCYPEPEALSLLVAQVVTMRQGMCRLSGGRLRGYRCCDELPRLERSLIDRLAVRLAGLPMAELFWWAEDTEYLQHRLPRKGWFPPAWTRAASCTT